MSLTTEDFYRSSNGVRWQLIRDTSSGRSFVRHEPNLSSGGRVTDTDCRGVFKPYGIQSGKSRAAGAFG